MKNLIKNILLGWIFTFGSYIISDLISKELAIINSKNNLNEEKTAILVSYEDLRAKLALKYFGGLGLTAYYFSKKGKIDRSGTTDYFYCSTSVSSFSINYSFGHNTCH